MTLSTSLPRLGRHSPRLAEVRRICLGEHPELTAVDGAKLIAELTSAGVVTEVLLLTEEALQTLAKGCATLPEKVFLVEKGALERVAPTQHPQGMLAVVKVPRHDVPARGTVLFLDRIQDPGNVGAVIRSARAFGATAVVCSEGSADPFSPRAIRASAGHALLLPVARHASFPDLAERFLLSGGEVVATVGHGGTPLRAWRPRPPVLLVMGNEGQGLAPEIMDTCSTRVSIPLLEGVESLNVAVAAGVILASVEGLAVAPILESKVRRRAR
jgi:TrmH family RNA methyltransferase